MRMGIPELIEYASLPISSSHLLIPVSPSQGLCTKSATMAANTEEKKNG